VGLATTLCTASLDSCGYRVKNMRIESRGKVESNIENKRILLVHNRVLMVDVGECPYVHNAFKNNKGFRWQVGVMDANHVANFSTHHIIITVTVVKQ
jgi:hypothetical protein